MYSIDYPGYSSKYISPSYIAMVIGQSTVTVNKVSFMMY